MQETTLDTRGLLVDLGQRAQEAARALAVTSTGERDQALRRLADALEAGAAEILAANGQDVAAARERGTSAALVDRLRLDPARVRAAADGLRQIAALPDPLGEVVAGWRRPNGLQIEQVRVPLGVVGIVYESRPNVTVDAAGLCLKSGNAVILRGGSDALRSNLALAAVMRRALAETAVPVDALQLVPTADRAAVTELLRLNDYLDVIIPRGGTALIREVVRNATVPVLETGAGVCHVYVDEGADAAMAERIVLNAKTQRPGVCNAIETLLVHERAAAEQLPALAARLLAAGVALRGCPETQRLVPEAAAATEEDWAAEYLDLVLAVRVVPDLAAALAHIARYGTRHSEAIVTRDVGRAEEFVRRVDAAAVYINASTRFTDGGEFGFGAEIGISTQKLHARGPMGLRALTSSKYIVRGNGQVRL